MSNDAIVYRHDLRNDQFVCEVLFPQLRGGYFVEAGATNGINGSGTYVLEKNFGWNGICVEPIPDQCRAIKRYRECHSLNACLFSRTGETIDFTIFSNRTGHSGITSFNKNLDKLRDESKESLKVKTITMLDLLKKFDAPTTIEYVSLDTEGSELEIVSAFPFDGEFRILAMSIEGHKCDDLLTKAKYLPIENPFSDAKFESYFIHESMKATVPNTLLAH